MRPYITLSIYGTFSISTLHDSYLKRVQQVNSIRFPYLVCSGNVLLVKSLNIEVNADWTFPQLDINFSLDDPSC